MENNYKSPKRRIWHEVVINGKKKWKRDKPMNNTDKSQKNIKKSYVMSTAQKPLWDTAAILRPVLLSTAVPVGKIKLAHTE